jgi:hypothetical protein
LNLLRTGDYYAVNLNSVFFEGMNDIEFITEENIDILEWSALDLTIVYKSRYWPDVGQLFASRVRKMRPQGAWFNLDKDTMTETDHIWLNLYNQSGPERMIDELNMFDQFGNLKYKART